MSYYKTFYQNGFILFKNIYSINERFKKGNSADRKIFKLN